MTRPSKLYRYILTRDLKAGADITGSLGILTLTKHARKGEVRQDRGRWYVTADGVRAARSHRP